MKRNKILVVNPNWNAYSETWLHRMMSYVEDDIVGLACFNPLQSTWKGKLVFNLDRRFAPKSTIKKLLLNIRNRIYSYNSDTISFQRFIKTCNPDVIWINFIGPALHLSDFLVLSDIPIVIHVHGIDVFTDARSEYTGNNIHPQNYVDLVREISKKRNVYFIANSKFTISFLNKFEIHNSKIFLKYFGVNVPDSPQLREQNTLQVLFIGRFVDFKGPDLVLKAFYIACDNGFKGSLTMIGDGPLKPMCLLLNSRSKYSHLVKFYEPIEAIEVSEFMKESDIFTMHNCYGPISKQYEAFGVTLIEAMSYGLPVVNGNCGGVKEIIDHNINGILVESLNIKEHAEAFLKLQNNFSFREFISRNAQIKVATKFNSRLESQKLRMILNQVVQQSLT